MRLHPAACSLLVTSAAACAPSWPVLRSRVHATPTGARLLSEADARKGGGGPPPPHTASRLRRFSAVDDAQVRVTLYRDDAAWCPYCQLVWLFLEEQEIPYHVVTLPLNAYGDKPAWYSSKVDGGKLPAVELDGELIVESAEIVRRLATTFGDGDRPLDANDERARGCLELHKQLMTDYFSFTFFPVEGEALSRARATFLSTLSRVDALLGTTPGPWFLGGDNPSVIDFQYVVHVERMIAAVLYWKGVRLRRTGAHVHLERWLEAFEARPSYHATRADVYSLVRALPSQNGPGYADVAEQSTRALAARIDGLDGAWELGAVDRRFFRSSDLPPADEPLTPLEAEGGLARARHEAAYALVANHEPVVTFACRGAGEPGRPSYHAELADPNAIPDEEGLGESVVSTRRSRTVHSTHTRAPANADASLIPCRAYTPEPIMPSVDAERSTQVSPSTSRCGTWCRRCSTAPRPRRRRTA